MGSIIGIFVFTDRSGFLLARLDIPGLLELWKPDLERLDLPLLFFGEVSVLKLGFIFNNFSRSFFPLS